jgi:hypothetical protein
MLSRADAHEEGAPFSGAIIDPLRVHHAHIEDEQRINLFVVDGLRGETDKKRSAFRSSLELALDWTGEFRLGSEILIPFSNAGVDRDEYGIGDIEFWPIKYAFINKPETIFTGVISLELPTGSERRGLGEGNTAVGALLFFDHAYRNWYWGVNTEVGTNVSGETGTGLELAFATSYSFIRETGGAMAPTRPSQQLVPSLSLEVISESVLNGKNEGVNIVTAVPGLNLWHPASGWAVRVGVEVPVSSEKENDFVVLFQIGNHLNWTSLFK